MSRNPGAVTPMAASRDLKTIRRAAKLACKLVAEIGERAKDKGKAEGILKSLRTRARGAPQLLSTWGATPFLIFYASKAIEASASSLKYIAQRIVCDSCNTGGDELEEIKSEALSYAIYLAALMYYHRTVILGQQVLGTASSNITFSSLVDKLIEYYLNTKRQHYLLYVVEHISRLITIYAEPVLNEAKETENNALVVEKCRLLGGEA